ncbi:MAG: indolepyruvate ferredoxin oxidoreductase subunit alpha [Gemmatimonadetes bacterium]|jgi:indolepyruvate ferredoxin oxidoreductase, alpha subunit|nr:indolepyruvate ferredoxin oxidoreductase subunit alpha [Gemmatimonadota bacterium]
MKTILSGNGAVARGVYEAGVEVAAAYPGTPSTEILEEIAANYSEIYAEWSVNEKVAFEVAFGASLGGKRALATMKHVGVNVAADALMTAAYTGVNGGMVLVSADDPGMHSSQNEQDNRYFARMAKIPMLEPSDSQESKDFAAFGFELSERFDTPVMLRMTTRICHGRSIVELGERKAGPELTYKKNPQKYVMIPAYARMRHEFVEKRRLELETFAEEFPGNRIEMGDPSIGIISSGVAYQYAREAFPEVSFLKLGFSNPLPLKLIREFAGKVEKLYVVEELEPFIEEQLRAVGLEVHGKDLLPRTGELSPEIIRQSLGKGNGKPAATDLGDLPRRPPVLCPGCPHRGLFHALKKARATVTGDIGCYTLSALPPLEMMDTCVCMGASIGVAQGLVRTIGGRQKDRIVAVLGDSTFIHSGIPSLVNAVYNKANITVVIADNRTTAMTGQQENPGTGQTLQGETVPELDFEGLSRSIGVTHVTTVDPLEVEACEKVIREALAHSGPSVVVARRACIFVDRDQWAAPLDVDSAACDNCKRCIRIGCPAISMDDVSAHVDQHLCLGCELCADICPQDAFIIPGVKENA